MSWSRFTTVLFCLALVGCGFRPLYGEINRGETTTSSVLATVEVAPIKDRVGQLVRNRLLDQLAPKGAASKTRYRLVVTLDISQEGIALARDETATRINLQLRAGYSLVDLQTGQKILQGSARSIAVYNVVSADFSTLTAAADARRRAALEIGDEIKTRLAVFFSRQARVE